VLVAAVAFALLSAAPAVGEETSAEPERPTRPRIGLALSGGGARGAAHVGVLQVLESLQVPVDYIAGTSMGAVVGGLYASGLTADELGLLLSSLDWDTLFSDKTRRRDISFRRKQDDRRYLSTFHFGFKDGKFQVPTGLIQGQKLEQTLTVLALPVGKVRDFDQLTIPFRAVATDIGTGGPVVLSGGRLQTAIRASMSIPGAFAPVEIDGRLLVDGGTAMNLPVDVVRDMGADVVIAVDIGTPLRSSDELTSALAITGQVVTIQIQGNTMDQISKLRENDVLIRPELGDVGTVSFDKVVEAATIGIASTFEESPDLLRLSISDEEWSEYRNGLVRPDTAPPMIDSVRIENESRLSDRILEKRIRAKSGERLDVPELRKDIDLLFGIDIFDSVDFHIDPLSDGGTELVLRAQERRTGVNRIRLGLNLESDLNGVSVFNLLGSVTRLPVNRLGAEWRTEASIGLAPGINTELWQPLDFEGRYFIAPEIGFRANNISFFDPDAGGQATVEYRYWRLRAGLGVGRQLGQWGEIRVGARFDRNRARPLVGDPAFQSVEEDEGEGFARFSIDLLDNSRFPTRGTLFQSEAWFAFDDLGSDQTFGGALARFTQALSWRRNTLLLEGQFGTSFNDEQRIGTLFPLGGFLRLSGLKPNELVGAHSLLFRIRGYRRLTELGVLSFQLPIYFGAGVESGNVYNDLSDLDGDSLRWGGHIYLAVDTPFSPLYLSWGHTQPGRNAFYFFLGQVF
jgi:NTE family protein